MDLLKKWFCIGKRENDCLKLRIVDADYAPDDLHNQLPLECRLIRMIAGSDRPDYWLAKAERPIKWGIETVNYLIVSARYVGVEVKAGIGSIVLGVAYVTDESLLDDTNLNFDKCQYIAICMAYEIKE
jgi:hypothetical protein